MSNISRERVYGCFFGQLVGDALGSRYEFGNSKDTIIKIYRDIDNNFLDPFIYFFSMITSTLISFPLRTRIKRTISTIF